MFNYLSHVRLLLACGRIAHGLQVQIYSIIIHWMQGALTLAGLEPAIFGSEDQRLIH